MQSHPASSLQWPWLCSCRGAPEFSSLYPRAIVLYSLVNTSRGASRAKDLPAYFSSRWNASFLGLAGLSDHTLSIGFGRSETSVDPFAESCLLSVSASVAVIMVGSMPIRSEESRFYVDSMKIGEGKGGQDEPWRESLAKSERLSKSSQHGRVDNLDNTHSVRPASSMSSSYLVFSKSSEQSMPIHVLVELLSSLEEVPPIREEVSLVKGDDRATYTKYR